MLFSGRGNDVEATAEAITADGWFRTGDLAKVDGDGYLTVLDRATDMIVVCSENVYRVGVERVLDGHPGSSSRRSTASFAARRRPRRPRPGPRSRRAPPAPSLGRPSAPRAGAVRDGGS